MGQKNAPRKNPRGIIGDDYLGVLPGHDVVCVDGHFASRDFRRIISIIALLLLCSSPAISSRHINRSGEIVKVNRPFTPGFFMGDEITSTSRPTDRSASCIRICAPPSFFNAPLTSTNFALLSRMAKKSGQPCRYTEYPSRLSASYTRLSDSLRSCNLSGILIDNTK